MGRERKKITMTQCPLCTQSPATIPFTLPETPSPMQITLCDTCHTNNGPGTGTGHLNGQVNFNDTNLSSSYDYDRTTNFGNTNCGAVNGCHNSDANDWTAGAGNLLCTDCHSTGYLADGVAMPTTGLHDETPTVSGEVHDETLDAAGCAVCHDDGAGNPSTAHIDGNPDLSSPAINFVATVNFSDGATPSCAPSTGCRDR